MMTSLLCEEVKYNYFWLIDILLIVLDMVKPPSPSPHLFRQCQKFINIFISYFISATRYIVIDSSMYLNQLV